ncbi:hypothetical protein BC826DRAFT_694104 [Russula brevipes]|nr:hypothetical protein BC826DRAFT_694104 [Russula brevipes]
MDTRGSHTISLNRGRSPTVSPSASPIRVTLGDDRVIRTTGTGAVQSYATTCASRTRTVTSYRSPYWPVAAGTPASQGKTAKHMKWPPSKSRSRGSTTTPRPMSQPYTTISSTQQRLICVIIGYIDNHEVDC